MQTAPSLDLLNVSTNKKITKSFDTNQQVLMSAVVIKINHVNKRQERLLILTSKNVYNVAAPSSIIPNRIKRKVPLKQIIGLSISRYNSQLVLHIDNEDDYRFMTNNLKDKFIQAIVGAYHGNTNQTLNVYEYDDLTLQNATTTIVDLKKKTRKRPTVEPLLVDPKHLYKLRMSKNESKLVFEGQTQTRIEYFEEFEIIKVLGRGAFGKVMMCRHQQSGQFFAVKSMRKENLIEHQLIQRSKVERYLLEHVNHPFLVSLEYAFQTKEKVFLVMKFYRGGDMLSRIRSQGCFPESRVKFYAAQILLGVKCLHELGFAYRDLKPENILFDTDGYIRVSDYGLAKKLEPGQRSKSIVGTPSYLPPEMIRDEGHTRMVDFWTYGTIIFEMLFRAPPFYLKNRQKMFKDIVFKQLDFPAFKPVSSQCKDLLRGLLSKHPDKRLGVKGWGEVQNHAWFKDIDWEALQNKQIKPDYVPSFSSEDDVSNFHDVFTEEEPINTMIDGNQPLLARYEQEFADFDFAGDKKTTMEEGQSFSTEYLESPDRFSAEEKQ